MDGIDLLRTLKFLPGIILGLTVHEFSHAYMAKRCGDLTSYEQGRVTLNPFRHIDLIGFIVLLVAGFGWAKPVQFNEKNLENPQKDVMKIAVAGPLSNALLAMILSYLYVLIYKYIANDPYAGGAFIREIFIYSIYINWGLFIFNMIPVPPLDGSHLLLNYFRRYPSLHEAMYKYGSLIFFALIAGTILTDKNFLPIWPAIQFLGEGFLRFLGFPF